MDCSVEIRDAFFRPRDGAGVFTGWVGISSPAERCGFIAFCVELPFGAILP